MCFTLYGGENRAQNREYFCNPSLNNSSVPTYTIDATMKQSMSTSYGSVASPPILSENYPPYSELESISRKYGASNWRTRGFMWLHKPVIIDALTSLLALDVLLLLLLLVQETIYPGCQVIENNCVCHAAEIHQQCVKSCIDTPVFVEHIQTLLETLSVGILWIFFVEITFHMACAGIHRYILADFIIVLVSIWLDTIVSNAESQALTIP